VASSSVAPQLRSLAFDARIAAKDFASIIARVSGVEHLALILDGTMTSDAVVETLATVMSRKSLRISLKLAAALNFCLSTRLAGAFSRSSLCRLTLEDFF